jgi:hypothetical protein
MGEENEQEAEPKAAQTPSGDAVRTHGGEEYCCAPVEGHNRVRSDSTVAPASRAGATHQLARGRRHRRRSPVAE